MRLHTTETRSSDRIMLSKGQNSAHVTTRWGRQISLQSLFLLLSTNGRQKRTWPKQTGALRNRNVRLKAAKSAGPGSATRQATRRPGVIPQCWDGPKRHLRRRRDYFEDSTKDAMNELFLETSSITRIHGATRKYRHHMAPTGSFQGGAYAMLMICCT
jgi:hypothetical protein